MGIKFSWILDFVDLGIYRPLVLFWGLKRESWGIHILIVRGEILESMKDEQLLIFAKTELGRAEVTYSIYF